MGNLRKIKRACQTLRPLPAPPADGGSQRMELDRSELEAILVRAKTTPMSEAEYAKLHTAIETLAFLTQELEKKQVSVQRLKQLLFGTTTETTRQVLERLLEDAEQKEDSESPAGARGQETSAPEKAPEHVNAHPFGGGRPRADDRKCLNAIWFVLRTGCQWNALDATGICPSSTAHDRFQEWVKAGAFLQLWEAGLLEYDQSQGQGLDWAWQSMDGAMTKAPLGGEKMWTEPYGPGQKRRQTQPFDGGPRRARRRGGGRGQPQ